jgi:hypothetical protein
MKAFPQNSTVVLVHGAWADGSCWSNVILPLERRREWISALDTIESLHPRAVIAGHKRPGKDDSPKIIEETRQYIRDFDRLAGTTTTARELYDKMLELHPKRVNPLPLWLSARAVKA